LILQAARRVFETIDRESRIDHTSTSGIIPTSVQGEIVFDNVHFAYPSRPDQKVADGYSLRVPAGKTVALVGASGSGKSTAVSLVERFYDPDSGKVMLDGVDLRELNVKWLREQIGLVGQEPVLFSGTIAENIANGRVGATRVEVEAAAKMANAHSFIMEFPDGYDTEVGEKGGQLSGGQKQRVAIARAMIKNPSILLLDEATSALDNESEKVVQQALDELMLTTKRTTIVIAHRLSTIRNADKICVVDKGRVIEEGTHDDLLALGEKGAYFKLHAASAREGAPGSTCDPSQTPLSVGPMEHIPSGGTGIGADGRMPSAAAQPGNDKKKLTKEEQAEEKRRKKEEVICNSPNLCLALDVLLSLGPDLNAF